ncbi:hypothetical protein KP509_12G013300 [Ceratopteris richardii]|nr:hypothetical protein KP509_12G013300 [Ceratopteris richardii]
MCRPRRGHVVEVKGEKEAAAPFPRRAPVHSKAAYSSSHSQGGNGTMMSRLVCRSSHDVINHVQPDLDNKHMNCATLHSKHGAIVDVSVPHVREAEAGASDVDVHELECRLRNAGLEERRRSSKKRNIFLYDEASVTSSGVSSSLSTSANVDTFITSTPSTSEMQDVILNANPAFDTNMHGVGDARTCLDDLRASIAQKKLLANPSPRVSNAENGGSLDGMSDEMGFCSSPSSMSSENVKFANSHSPRCSISPSALVQRSNFERLAKHADMAVSRRLHLIEDGEYSQLTMKQSKRDGGVPPREFGEIACEHRTGPRRAARRSDMGTRKETADVVHHGNVKRTVNRSSGCSAVGDGRVLNRFDGGSAQGSAQPQEANMKQPYPVRQGGLSLGCNEEGTEQDLHIISSSSCEIQVLSDHTHDNLSDNGHKRPALSAMHGGRPMLPSEHQSRRVESRASEEGSRIAREVMGNDNAVAMVKTSYDPRHDFKESMREMVAAKALRTPSQLQQLLQCYLSLNAPHYHPTIVKAFHELCSQLFN